MESIVCVSLGEVRNNFLHYFDNVETDDWRVIITQPGEPAALMMKRGGLMDMLETIKLLKQHSPPGAKIPSAPQNVPDTELVLIAPRDLTAELMERIAQTKAQR